MTGFVLLCITSNLAASGEFGPARGFENYSDSLRSLPPRMRPFFSAAYRQQVFNAPRQESLNMRCVGRWPFGNAFNVRGQGNRLYLGAGAGIYILDIANPPNPVRLGQVCAKGLINQLVIRDTLLYVGSRGLEIFNVSNPANPFKYSWLDIPVSDVFVQDSFAYCVSDDSLRIVNVRNPYNPFKVGVCSTYSWSVFVSGNYAYVGGRYQLSIIDVSNPANPRKINSISAYVYSIFITGNHCYYVTSDNVLHILNIRDPLSPWEEGSLTGVYGMDLQVSGIFAYVPSFAIIDISDSSNPTRVGGCSLPAPGYGVWTNSAFGYSFIADQYEGLQVINISNPVNPWIEGRFDGADDSRDVFVLGNYAYVSNLRSGLKILDVSNPANPFQIGEYDTLGNPYNLRTAWVRDTLAYLPVFAKFKILNIRNPSAPRLIGECIAAVGGEGLYLKDSIAYMVDGAAFQRVKVKNPTLPETLPRYILPSSTSWSVSVEDTIAYIANSDAGLRILNVANPARPVEIGHFDNPPSGRATGVFIKDTLAYFATSGGGLRILNVKNPTSPFEVGFHPAYAFDVAIVDSLAFVTSSSHLRVINVSNPISPIETGYYVIGPRKVFVLNDLIYVACYEAGVYILSKTGTSVEEDLSKPLAAGALRLRIVPNPASGKVVICWDAPITGSGEIALHDIAGCCVARRRFERFDGHLRTEFSLNHLPNGIYFVVLTTEGNQLARKIVVIR